MRMVAPPAFDVARTCGVVGKAAEVHDQHWRQLEQLDGLGGIRLHVLRNLQSGMDKIWVSNGNPSSLTVLIASVSTLSTVRQGLGYRWTSIGGSRSGAAVLIAFASTPSLTCATVGCVNRGSQKSTE